MTMHAQGCIARRVYDRFRASVAGRTTFLGKFDAVLDAAAVDMLILGR